MSDLFTTDGLQNLVAGLGTDKDKATATRWRVTQHTADQFEEIYRSGWIARKIVDIPVDDATRKWRGWNADDVFVEAIEAAEKRWKTRQIVAKAKRWARIYGSSAIVVGASTRLGLPGEPLDVSKMQKGDLAYLHVEINPRLQILEWETDILSPEFGGPKLYRYVPQVRGATATPDVPIHASRVIPFSGLPLPPMAAHFGSGWGDSIFTALADTLNTAGSITGVIASLIYEAKVDIMKVDLSGIGTPDGEDRIRRRFMLANVLKSINNMLLMGQGEEYDRKTYQFAGLSDIHIRVMQEVSGAADIPVTRLLGQSPAGMSSTGESDIRNYYDRIEANQESELRGPIERLDALLIASEGIAPDPDGWWFFHSLWQESATQKADNLLKRAQAAKTLADTGLIPDIAFRPALVSQLVEAGDYPALEAEMEKYEKPGDPLAADPDDGADEIDAPPQRERPRLALVRDAAPRTLYVSRRLLNARDVIDWARSQGLKNLVLASQMHATVAYSRTPFDWMTVGETWNSDKVKVYAGGPRLVEPIGTDGAVALLFASGDLEYRWREICEAGASWDHDGYQPHVTLTYDPGDVDLTKIAPYNGPLTFGPEIFAEIAEGASAQAA